MSIRGFTLIELVGVMLVISIGFLGLARLFANMDINLAKAEAQDKTLQYAQACAEYVFQSRRDLGYCTTAVPCTTTVNSVNVTYLSTTMCASLVSTADTAAGYTVGPLTISNSGTSATGMCATGAVCRDVTIPSSGGGVSSSVTITLASY
jgi:prepilin-type N-terminal cleavage/methylation domain-containing protein